jgi:hypothetical protein
VARHEHPVRHQRPRDAQLRGDRVVALAAHVDQRQQVPLVAWQLRELLQTRRVHDEAQNELGFAARFGVDEPVS